MIFFEPDFCWGLFIVAMCKDRVVDRNEKMEFFHAKAQSFRKES
jgi:hypothetical protein